DKAARSLASAQILLNDGDVDGAVSRAYYAARYICLHLLEREGLRLDQKWTHTYLIGQTVRSARNKQWLRQVTMAGEANFRDSLDSLVDSRRNADYRLSEVTQREAERALKFAAALLAAV